MKQNYYLVFIPFVCTFGCVGGGLLYGQESILYRLMRGGFGYQHLFCHALPSHSLFPPTGCFVFAPPRL